jgi:hypothetical protein
MFEQNCNVKDNNNVFYTYDVGLAVGTISGVGKTATQSPTRPSPPPFTDTTNESSLPRRLQRSNLDRFSKTEIIFPGQKFLVAKLSSGKTLN